jgi:hypothetical protein
MGGLYGASKYRVLSQLPLGSSPTTIRFEAKTILEDVMASMCQHQIGFPLVVKPDFGERGQGVDLIRNEQQLKHSIQTQTSAFILQPYLDMPFEAGVFFIRHPEQQNGRIPSIVVKGFLKITGNGVETVEQLAQSNKRAYLIWPTLKQNLDVPLTLVLKKGEELILEPIGNHSRGTAFNDHCALRTSALETWAERIAASIPGFYYGRFDLRAPSESAFMKGEGIQIMEVNGANAEPAHIYQEGASLWKAWFTLLKFWNEMASIAKHNLKDKQPVDFATALIYYRQWKSIKKDKWNRMPLAR